MTITKKVSVPPPTPEVVPASPESISERVAHQLSRPKCALPLIGLSLLALGWSLFVRLPQRSIAVEARTTERAGMSNFVVSAEMVRELDIEGQIAAQQLIHEPAEFPRLVSRLEESARALGFQAQISIKPAITNAFGFRELAIHPVAFRLESTGPREQPAFGRALEWLRGASTLGRKVESQSLSLGSQVNGVAWAQVELRFWSISTHEEPAKK